MSLVSVIVPIYNSEKYLEKCIRSIVESSYEKLEILLIDDGSTDESEKIGIYFTKIDNRIKYYKKQNNGVSSARNVGISFAKGEFITFVDSDDWIDKDRIKDLMMFSELDFVYAGYKNVYNNNILNIVNHTAEIIELNSIIENFPNFWMNNPLCFTWNSLYKKNIIDLNNLKFDESVKIGEDVLFNLEYISKCKTIGLCPNTGYFHEKNLESLVHKFYENIMEKEQKECECIQSFSNEIDYRMRWFFWNSAINHYLKWKQKGNYIIQKKAKQGLKKCITNPYFRESINYIIKNGSKDEKIFALCLRMNILAIYKIIYKFIVLYEKIRVKKKVVQQ